MKTYTIEEIVHQLQTSLQKIHTKQTALQCAWWLIQWATGKNHTYWLTRKQQTLTEQQHAQLMQALEEHIVEHKPLHYILGSVPFLNLEIIVEPPILIPRPETEQWCSDLIDKLNLLQDKNLRILDMCTGSGCIGLALAHALPNSFVDAVDISLQACKLAQKNAQLNNIKNINIIESDLFAQIPVDTKYDLIVSNPPYIAYDDWLKLDPHIKLWEDPQALWTEDQGYTIIKSLVSQARTWLRYRSDFIPLNIPQLIIEIGSTQGNNVKEYMLSNTFTSVTITKDNAGLDRIVSAGIDI